MNIKGKLLLDVPYKEKDEAKALGAHWNPDLKKWVATDRTEYYRFLKWLPKDTLYVVFDSIYLVVANRACYKCQQMTRVVGFSNPDYISFYNYVVDEDAPENVAISTNIDDGFVYDFYENRSIGEQFIYDRPYPMPKGILEFLQKNFNYKMKYSHTKQYSELSNCCDHCDALQGDHFLFDEPSSPFWPHTPEEAGQIEFFQIELEYDLPFKLIGDGNSSVSDLLERFGKFKKLDIPLGTMN